MENLKSIVEAIIFASDTPLSPKQIKDIINEPAKKFSSNGETGGISLIKSPCYIAGYFKMW